MLQQTLGRYVSLNQIGIRFLFGLLFHVEEIDSEFFVLNSFRLFCF